MTAGAPTTVDPGDVAVRLSEVRRRIASAGGGDRPIRIVAVTKGFGPDAVRAAVAAGVHDVGENYADELVAKHAAATATDAAGPAADAAASPRTGGTSSAGCSATRSGAWPRSSTCGRPSTGPPPAEEIARRAPGARVLVQLNVTGQAGSNGCVPADAPALVDELRAMELDVVGLMAVGPAGPPEHARAAYRGLAAMADRLELPERSMGMTDDLEVAVEEGTTMVRVGRALFGARSVPTDLRR